jgi:hypothetical protein
MNKLKKGFFKAGLGFLLVSVFIFTGTANALEFELEPASATIAVDGCEISVQIYADSAVDLISMGVKVSFDPVILEVVEASKNEDFNTGWVMDADGDPMTTGDQYTFPIVEIDNENGTVTMIGGRLMGSATQGLSGKVFLGEIIFRGISNGVSALNVDLAKYHPNDPAETYDNFVRLDGTVNEPINAPSDLGEICVKLSGDVDGDGYVNIFDRARVRNHFLESGPPGWIPEDLNCDGYVNIFDRAIVRNQFLQTGYACP